MSAPPNHNGPTDASLYSGTVFARVLGPMTTFLILAVLSYIGRMHSRIFHYRNVGLDDYAMTLAVALSVADYGFTLAGQMHTGGKHMFTLDDNDLQYAMKLSFISIFFWAWAVALVKISVCIMLIRIQPLPSWKWGVGIMIAIQILSASAVTGTVLAQCSPISANWNHKLPGAKCWTPHQTEFAVYPTAAVYIATDAICALLPIAFIYRVHRPLREKVVLAVIMGLGLVASACGLAKVFLIANISEASDPLWQNANAFVLAYSEQNLGIIAANIPCLKTLLEGIFVGLGGKLKLSSFSRKRQMDATPRNTSKRVHSGGSAQWNWNTKSNSASPHYSQDAEAGPIETSNSGSNRQTGIAVPYIMKETAVVWNAERR